MEMHSYAKTRTNKKWTLEHKRKLVDNRITLDVLFNKKAFNLADSWKKLTKVSDMDSFDVLFVRKQWTNILIKYKNLVQRHAINHQIDSETLDLLTAEWEFFDKIHRWVKLKEKVQKDYKSIIHEEIENETLNQNIIGSEISSTYQSQQQYSARDSSEDDEQAIVLNNSPVNIVPILNRNNDTSISNKRISHLNEETHKNIAAKSTPSVSGVLQQEQQQTAITKLTKVPIFSSSSLKTKELSKKRKSEEICRLNALTKAKLKHRKLEKKFDRLKHDYFSQKFVTKRLAKKLNAFCEIFAKVIKEEYPDINVLSLMNDEISDSSSCDSSDSD